MKTVLITGGTGMIGRALVSQLLFRGYKVIVLSRTRHQTVLENMSYAYWHVEKQEIDEDAIREADYIIHLAGANISEKRWTKDRKANILASRVDSSTLLYKTLSKVEHKTKKIISASAIGWYGPDIEKQNSFPFVEQASHFDDFLGNTCYSWEQAIAPVRNLGICLAILRAGIVLSAEGGVVEAFMKPLKFGFATVMGSGKQMISWIHIDDLVRLYIEVMENKDYSGIYNAVAPAPVSNRTLVVELAKSIRGKYYSVLPVPKLFLKLVVGEMSTEVLKSTTVSCSKVEQAGFVFTFPTIQLAMKEVVRQLRK